MKHQLDGSEASMMPILIKHRAQLFRQRIRRGLHGLEEFSVGGGIADLYRVKSRIASYSMLPPLVF